ncbi:MAG: hypothetical protein FJX56_09205 [Alphaproteobacteria bacterium]|nr:hypothetical protein [Alphaproteobacteria bacterium]
MIRPWTLGALAVVAVLAAIVFRLKGEVQRLEDRIATLEQAIIAEGEAIRVLDAEWSYLNRPERLASLTAKHLGLVPMVGPQMIASVADLPYPVPAAEAPLLAEDRPAPGLEP